MSSPSPAESPSWSRLRLPEPDENFYSETERSILAACGVGRFEVYDFDAALELLENRAKLRIDPVERDVLTLMFTRLSRAVRFGEDYLLEKGLGENSAVHSLHCVGLYNEMYRRPGLLDEKKQDAAVTKLRQDGSLACLLHDNGEILGEYSSLAQRSLGSRAGDSRGLERAVFRCALTIAFHSVQENEKVVFYEEIDSLADLVSQGLEHVSEYSMLIPLVGKYQDRCMEGKSLSKANERRLNRFIRIFDLVEAPEEARSDREKFCGWSVKVVEHLQGTRHLLRFCTKSPGTERMRVFTTPTLESDEAGDESRVKERATLYSSDTPSARVLQNMDFLEYGLGELFACASREDEAQMALAKAIRNAVYETAIEFLSISSSIVDRTATEENPEVKAVAAETAKENPDLKKLRKKIRRAEKALEEERKVLFARRDEMKATLSDDAYSRTLLPIETRERLMSLYRQAINQDHIPSPGEVLIRLDGVLPGALQGLR